MVGISLKIKARGLEKDANFTRLDRNNTQTRASKRIGITRRAALIKVIKRSRREKVKRIR